MKGLMHAILEFEVQIFNLVSKSKVSLLLYIGHGAKIQIDCSLTLFITQLQTP